MGRRQRVGPLPWALAGREVFQARSGEHFWTLRPWMGGLEPRTAHEQGPGEGPPLALSWRHPGGATIAIASEDGTVSGVDSSTGEEILRIKERDNAVFGLDWRNEALAAATGAQTVDVHTIREGSHIPLLAHELAGHHGSVKEVAFNQFHGAGAILASASRDGDIRIWDVRLPKGRQCISRARLAHQRALPPRSSGAATSVAWLAGGDAIASGGDKDGLVRVWDARALGKHPAPLHAIGSDGARLRGVTSLSSHPTEPSFIGVAWSDGTAGTVDGVRGYTAGQTLALGQQQGERSFFVRGGWSADGLFFACGDGKERVALWNVGAKYPPGSGSAEPLKPDAWLLGHEKEVTALAWHPSDPGVVATCSEDGTTKAWRCGGDVRFGGSHDATRLPRNDSNEGLEQSNKDDDGAVVATASVAPVCPRKRGRERPLEAYFSRSDQ